MCGLSLRLPLTVGIPVTATAASLALGVGLVAVTGAPLGAAIASFWDGMFGSTFAVGASINRAVALTLVGLGFILANRANLTNVGGEGQLAVGGIAATAPAPHGAQPLPLGLSVLAPPVVPAPAGAPCGGVAGGLTGARGT